MSEVVAFDKKGNGICVGDFLKCNRPEMPRLNDLRVIRLDSTSDSARPSLLCYGGDRLGKAKCSRRVQFYTLYADQCEQMYSVRKTEKMRERLR